MTGATAVLLAAAGDVPQNPWPFVIAGYVIMALGLVAVGAQTIIRGRRLAQRVPPDQQRWLDVHVAQLQAARAHEARTGHHAGEQGHGTLEDLQV